MLANLIPEERWMERETNGNVNNKKHIKKQSTSTISNNKTSSVLADIGNKYYGKSPPRSNKELKEMRSSVMEVGFDKKDASFSVFDMLLAGVLYSGNLAAGTGEHQYPCTTVRSLTALATL